MKKILVLDCNYLCHRLFYGMKNSRHLSHNGQDTAIIYGFLRDLKQLMERHETEHVVFCFDSKHSKRKRLYPEYKANRQYKYDHMEKKERKSYDSMRQQIQLLRRKILPKLGFQNVIMQKGFEADDMIACVVTSPALMQDIKIIVSADKDMYQLLSLRTKIWSPAKEKFYTIRKFREDFGLEFPDLGWTRVLTLTGCSTDNVPGCKGVGEINAIKYSSNPKQIKPGHKLWKVIRKYMKSKQAEIANRLVTLPFMDLGFSPYTSAKKLEKLLPDQTSPKRWKRVLDRYGIRSLNPSDMTTLGVRIRKKKRKGFIEHYGKGSEKR